MTCRPRPNKMIPAAAAMALAAALLLMPPPSAARADSISTGSSGNAVSIEKYGRTWYEHYVTTTSPIATADPNATAPQVIAALPTGTKIEPPDSTLYPNNNSPQAYALTYTDSSGKTQTTLSNSSGFTQSQMVLGLNNDATTGQQLFGLSFYGTGLAATNTAKPSSGGLADIWLSFDNSVTKQPQFQSVSPKGVSIVPVPKTTSTTTPTTPTVTTTTTTATTPVTTASAPTSTPATIPEPMSIALWSLVIGLGVVRARTVRNRRTAV